MKIKKIIIKPLVLIILILSLILTSKIPNNFSYTRNNEKYNNQEIQQTTQHDTNNNNIDNKKIEQAEKQFYHFNQPEIRKLTEIEDKTKNKLVTKVKNILHDKKLKLIDLNNPAYIKKLHSNNIEYSKWKKYNHSDIGFVFVYKQETEISITNALIEKHYKTSDFDSIMLYDIEKSTVGTTSRFIGGKQIVNKSIIIKLTLKSNANIDKYGGFVDENGDNTLIIKIWIKNKIDDKDIVFSAASNILLKTEKKEIKVANLMFPVTYIATYETDDEMSNSRTYDITAGLSAKLRILDPLVNSHTMADNNNDDRSIHETQFMNTPRYKSHDNFISYWCHIVQNDSNSLNFTSTERYYFVQRWINNNDIHEVENYNFNQTGKYFIAIIDYLQNTKYYVLEINGIGTKLNTRTSSNGATAKTTDNTEARTTDATRSSSNYGGKANSQQTTDSEDDMSLGDHLRP